MPAGTVSPITLELVQGALESAVREMELLMERTAMSPFIKEKKDYFVGIFDRDGRMVCAHVGNSGPGMIEPVLKVYPREDMRPGDIYWYNDPYATAGAVEHSPDMVFVMPVFFGEELVAFALTFGHFWDIGGTMAGSISPRATEIYHEGVLVPPIRIYRAGQLNEEVYRVFLRNSRFPDMLEGDTRAMHASCRLGERRVIELFERFGHDVVLTAFDELIANARRTARRLVGALIKEGTYESSAYVDGDGLSNRSFKIQLRLERRGERVTVDLTESDDQAPGPINFTASLGVVRLMLTRYLISREPSLALNEGSLDVVDELKLRPGSLVSPTFPAPVGVRAHTKFQVANGLIAALAQATDGQTIACWATYVLVYIRLRPAGGGTLLYVDGIAVGMGARPFADGLSAIYSGTQKNYPAEFVEQEFPLRLERYSHHADSGGPGLHRGGCGVVRDFRILAPEATLATRMSNFRHTTWGVRGGRSGRPGRFILNPDTPEERELSPMAEGIQVQRGDLVRVCTSGGGGWGSPLERDPELVRRDVAQGFVSREAAARDYGVALDPRSLAVDEAATRRLRAARPPSTELFDFGEVIGEPEMVAT